MSRTSRDCRSLRQRRNREDRKGEPRHQTPICGEVDTLSIADPDFLRRGYSSLLTTNSTGERRQG